METKIALCFLTYGNLSQPKLWEKFQNSKYNIYIHNKQQFTGNFQKYCIENTIDTEWGHISIVRATLNLFKTAFENKENKYFILLSDTCIPLYSSDVVYEKICSFDNNLLNAWKTDVDDSWHKSRYNSITCKDFFDENDFYGQHQWMVLKRDTVRFFINNDYTHIFRNTITAPDEIYFINILNKFNISYKSKFVTYVNWDEESDLKIYRDKPKTYSKLNDETIHAILKRDCLFMRKIGPECALPSYFDSLK